MPPHIEGVCLLGSTGEAEDLPLKAHQALVTKISSRESDIPLEKDSVGPHLQSSKCQPDDSLVLKYCNFEEYSLCIFCGPRWSNWENHLYYIVPRFS